MCVSVSKQSALQNQITFSQSYTVTTEPLCFEPQNDEWLLMSLLCGLKTFQNASFCSSVARELMLVVDVFTLGCL